MKKFSLEMLGTFVLVLFGCGSAVFSGQAIGQLGISMAFGIAIVSMAYAIGPHTGCHINPAVSWSFWLKKELSTKDFFSYVSAQLIGATLGALVIFGLAKGQIGGYEPVTQGLGQNGWGIGYLGEFGVYAAFFFEFLATFVFVYVIHKVVAHKDQALQNGLVIGLTLTAIHLVGIPITGVSVNPARSFGPALFVGAKAIGQLWLFFLSPFLGATLAALVTKKNVQYQDSINHDMEAKDVKKVA